MSRLERLMGTNVVRITDRKYMLELQRRLREDHIRGVRERIRAREVDELEREKKLILSGRMSLDEAPKELVDHPVFQISQFIKNILLGGKMAASVSHSTSSRQILSLSRSCLASEDGAERSLTTPTTLAAASAAAPAASTTASASSRAASPRASPRANSPRDRSPREEDADEGAATEVTGEEGSAGPEAAPSPGQEGEVEEADAQEVLEDTESATEAQNVVVQVEEHEDGEEAEEGEEEDMSGMSACDFEEDFDRQADIERGYMFTQEDYDRIKFEAESVKKMWELETVEELYALAESIVKEMVAQGGAPAPAAAKPGDRTPSPARSTKSPPPGPGPG
ncbi:A disintegrin and metalloproteinase with thrombospondin motifs 20 [Frankliniella fusca]|uniref:A disintegrin and metalloproteinase with thrombospondin motifs 20 n=1 Tax=Frankliniella fusca TaxID=407009 RepID=A0AAE1GQR6_9NEOP|nr:A disintegrin and metalloproteinase with thrombospondin motifs 20 [Frankliniella fusca]